MTTTIEPAVQRFAEVLQEHLNETTPRLGPWQEVQPEYAYWRILKKATEMAQRAESYQDLDDLNADTLLEPDLVKLACRVFIAMGVSGMLEPER